MILEIEDKDLEEIINIRHDIHAHPEISGKEIRTTELIKDFAKSLDHIEEVSIPIASGAVFRLKSDKGGKTIAIRSDIDAISQQEDLDIPYKSKCPGIMHACGHDLHISILMACMNILSKNRDRLRGDVVFVFQNSEETTKGAKELIDKGLFDKVNIDYFLGYHNWPLVDAGKVIVKKGALMAAKTNFIIEVIGRGGHGSDPHLNIDPIVCAGHIITGLQTVISRNTDPKAPILLSINSIRGGSEDNLLVDTCKMTATIRSLDKKNFAIARQRAKELIRNIAKAFSCEVKITYTDDIDLVYNSEDMYELARGFAEEIVGRDKLVDIEATMASEDFSLYMQRVPSFMYWFGSSGDGFSKNPLHTKKFYASDKAIKSSAQVLVNAVLGLQGK
ncbi:M20 family metallopeptidase [Anaerococcus sp. AGMB09787]|uniref:M20 metallopeptidase family protein n=1 Tax=Anaerococcus sp. AGMB09787 TaxID=2922869 RepID=UPI001FAFA5B3|nr:M20 family metallopeptidase [Anaerococcus sp. AGMB09787]